MKAWIGVGFVTILVLLAFGCATALPTAPGRGYLVLNVQPASAEVFIDSNYLGIVNGWRDRTIPLASGDRRVEVRADGFITQRFDILIRTDEQVVLTLEMEPVLELQESPEESQ
jgi:hypothetical protein